MDVLRSLGSDAPLSAMIEIADRCNEVCVHCYQVQGQKGEMSTQEVFQVLDQLAEMGVLFLIISGGEATLRRDFLDIVDHARKHRFAVKIYTNGLTMTPALAQRLATLGVQEVHLSLYSPRPEVHDWVTRVPGSFDKVVAGTRFLRDVGVPVVLKGPLTSFNVHEYGEYIELATSLGADYTLDPELKPREDGDRSPEAFGIGEEDYRRVRADPRLRGPTEPAQPPEKGLDGRPCGACLSAVHVEPNGEVRPCAQLTVPLGNALTDGVRSAWTQSDVGRGIRSLTWGDHHGCRDCDLRRYCGRCYASALREAGDALGPYTAACRAARLRYEVAIGREATIGDDRNLGRNPSLGPYEELGTGELRLRPDRVTEHDRDRAFRLQWVRSRATAAPPSASAGQLVQIRRPGRKSRLEEVPPNPASNLASSQDDVGSYHTSSSNVRLRKTSEVC